jgi:thymidylate synthase (FAD)
MHTVNPRIFIIAETKLLMSGYELGLAHLGADGWRAKDAKSEAEELCEFAGRLCYKSFSVELNKNLTRTREGNREYLGNVLDQKHGSIFEHMSTSVLMLNVSRILTHEYVRHRAGKAYSQESMRFVRLDDIPIHIPNLTEEFATLINYRDEGGDSARELQGMFEEAVTEVTKLAELYISKFNVMLDDTRVPFAIKKKITSALRRMAPGGHATNILGTGTHRAWRHLIAQRTSRHAEAEIRAVFNDIAEQFWIRYPAVYQDMSREFVDGYYEYTFRNDKI